MGQLDLNKTTTTDMNSGMNEFKVSSQTLDEPSSTDQRYDSPNFKKYFDYYKQIPELKKAIDALAMWTVGKGYKTDTATEVILSNITGWGEDSIQGIFFNMIITKKFNGDAFAEIIRNQDTGTLINLKPLNPSRIRIVVNNKGIIKRYEEVNAKGESRNIAIDKMFHISNDRIINEIHGVSVIEACQWVIDARNEAMSDWRRISHRSTIRVLYVDDQDSETLATIKSEYKNAGKETELMIIPGKAADNAFQDLSLPPIQNFLDWIRYLENFFYQAVGVPKIILGGSQEFTEASSKIGYLTFEQVYMAEQRLLEQDIWNQLAVRVEFDRPVSLKDKVVGDEAKNTGQVGVQPNETQTGVQRTE